MRWRGVHAAVPTPFGEDEALDLGALEAQLERLVEAGVAGIVVLAPLGEGTSLTADERRAVLHRAVLAVDGRVPVTVGVCETTTRAACHLAADCERAGADALVVLACPPYRSDERETLMHLRSVAAATELPVMVHGDDVAPALVAELAELGNVEAVVECGLERMAEHERAAVGVLAGADELVVESVLRGAQGQLGGVVNVFPHDAVELFELAAAGRWDDALALHRRLAPLLRAAPGGKRVQAIKLAQLLMGVGTETVRAPRLPLTGAAREAVERAVAAMREGLDERRSAAPIFPTSAR
jgi:4-hydroxy-tetrahydrodipicolinate synthase